MAGTIVANTLNTDTGVYSTNNAYSGIAKAWVYYNGTTQTIIASYNVSSITYVNTGTYTVNFATPFADTSYAAFTSVGKGTIGSSDNIFVARLYAPSTGSQPCYVVDGSGTNTNADRFYYAAFHI